MEIKINEHITIKKVKLGDYVCFEGLNCEEGHNSFIGEIEGMKVKGYLNLKTGGVYKLKEWK